MKIYRKIKNKVLACLGYKTVGARALIIENDKILLVEHTYMPRWYTVGGGVEKGETPRQAIAREILEEVGIQAKTLKLFSVYHSNYEKRDDYIILYICDNFIVHKSQPSIEIKNQQWFKLDDLPATISPGTLRRIQEYQGKLPINEKW